jgi:hypothetical protein
MVTGTVVSVGRQEWYCFLDGSNSGKKSHFTLCFEVINERRLILVPICSLIDNFFKCVYSMKCVV